MPTKELVEFEGARVIAFLQGILVLEDGRGIYLGGHGYYEYMDKDSLRSRLQSIINEGNKAQRILDRLDNSLIK